MSGCVHGTVRYLWAPSSGAPVSRISPVVCVLKHAVSWPAGALPHVFSQNGVQCDPAHFALLVERWRQSVPVRYHVTARLRACVHVVNALSRAYICRLFRFPLARASDERKSKVNVETASPCKRRALTSMSTCAPLPVCVWMGRSDGTLQLDGFWDLSHHD